MLNNKIKQIEELTKEYILLMQQEEETKNKNRYKGILQGLNLALVILKEQEESEKNNEDCVEQLDCLVCGEKIMQMFYPVVRVGENILHVECYDKIAIE